MISDKMIIEYLDGLMTDSQKTEFENMLKESDELKARVREIEKFLGDTKKLRDINISQEYLDEVVPRFRASQNKNNKRSLSYRLASGFAGVIFFAFAAFFIFNQLETDYSLKLADVVSDISYDEINNYISSNDYSDLIVDLEVEDDIDLMTAYTNQLENEISNNTENLGILSIGDINLNSIDQLLSEDQLNEVYSTLLDKDFF